MSVRFARRLDPGLADWLSPGGWLAAWTAPRVVQTSTGPLRTRLWLRERREAMLYLGGSRVLVLRPAGDGLRVEVSRSYRELPGAGALDGRWPREDPALPDALDALLATARPDITSESRVQALWHDADTPWQVFDQEARFGYPSRTARSEALDLPGVTAAEHAIRRVVAADPATWKALPPRPSSNSRDQLAIDDQGRLVIVELKVATAGSGLFYGPLQLVRYLHEDAANLPALRPSLARLLADMRRLGSVSEGPALGPHLRPVLAWGTGTPSPEVMRRLQLVLATANDHRPPDTLPIELWHLPDGQPERLA